MQNDGGITASGAFFDSVVAKSDFVNSGYILSVIFQIVATVRLILSGLVVIIIYRMTCCSCTCMCVKMHVML